MFCGLLQPAGLRPRGSLKSVMGHLLPFQLVHQNVCYRMLSRHPMSAFLAAEMPSFLGPVMGEVPTS